MKVDKEILRIVVEADLKNHTKLGDTIIQLRRLLELLTKKWGKLEK